MGNGFVVSHKTKCMPTLRTTTKCIPKENECICLSKDIYMTVHSSFIYSNPKLQTIQNSLSVGEWMNKLWCIHMMKHYTSIFFKKNEQIVHKKHLVSWILDVVLSESRYKRVHIIHVREHAVWFIYMEFKNRQGRADLWW